MALYNWSVSQMWKLWWDVHQHYYQATLMPNNILAPPGLFFQSQYIRHFTYTYHEMNSNLMSNSNSYFIASLQPLCPDLGIQGLVGKNTLQDSFGLM